MGNDHKVVYSRHFGRMVSLIFPTGPSHLETSLVKITSCGSMKLAVKEKLCFVEKFTEKLKIHWESANPVVFKVHFSAYQPNDLTKPLIFLSLISSYLLKTTSYSTLWRLT